MPKHQPTSNATPDPQTPTSYVPSKEVDLEIDILHAEPSVSPQTPPEAEPPAPSSKDPKHGPMLRVLLLLMVGSLAATVSPAQVCFPTQTFDAAGSFSYTIPAGGIFAVNFTARGADGGNSEFGLTRGGTGAIISANFHLESGDVLDVYVGGPGDASLSSGGAGGGGGSAVILDEAHVLVAAGAGGGSGGSTSGAGGGGRNNTMSPAEGGGGGIFSIAAGGGGYNDAGEDGAFGGGSGGGAGTLTGLGLGGGAVDVKGGNGWGGGGAGHRGGSAGGGGGGYEGGDGGNTGQGGQGGNSFVNTSVANGTVLSALAGVTNGSSEQPGAITIECVAPLSIVTTTLDEADGSCADGDCSLRDAIALSSAGSLILFDTALNGQTINLSLGASDFFHLVIDKDLTLDASTLPDGLTLHGDGTRTIIQISESNTATLRSLTLTGGASGAGAGGVRLDGDMAVLEGVTVIGNSGTAGGGVVAVSGSLFLRQSTVSGNTATFGGGVYTLFGTTTIEQSTITDNTAINDGGGVFTFGSGTTTASGSIIAGNSGSVGGEDCFGFESEPLFTAGYNLFGTGTGCPSDGSTDATVDPATVFTHVLWPLANNGGPTATHMLRVGSPAIDAIPADGGSKTSALGCGTTFATDQRGLSRPVDLTDSGCDIGAVEAQSPGELPVELVAFEALRDGNTVMLLWETASETNNAGFEVQVREDRSATRDAGWQVLGFVDGVGTTIVPQTYTFDAAALEPGLYTFRLRQVDYDGTFAYSPQVEVTIGVTGAYELSSVYPNPFRAQTQFSLAVGRTQNVRVAVYDVLGRRVALLFDGELAADRSRGLVWEARGQASGLYLLRVEGEHFVATRQVTLTK